MTPANVAFDFRTPPVDVSWIKAESLRASVSTGVRVDIDFSRRGHLPARLRCRDESERNYIQALVRDGIIIPGRARFCHRHFFLRAPKPRLIFDGRRLNRRSIRPPWFYMTSHTEFARYCRRYKYAAKFDFKNFYFNLRLRPELWSLFGFRTDLGDFLWTRAPFGWAWSASFANDLAEAVVDFLRSLGVVCLHYMDDLVIFADDLQACEQDLLRSIAWCESVGLRVSPGKTVHACSALAIVGIFYNLSNKTSSLPAGYLDRVDTLLDIIVSRGHRASRIDMASVVGSLVFANHAFPGSLSYLHPLFSFSERFSGPWRLRVPAGPFVLAARRIVSLFRSFPPCILQTGGEMQSIFCDAVPDQLGVVMDNLSVAQPVPLTHVFIAEAQAVDLGLSLSTASAVTVYTDNQPLQRALTKGHSTQPRVNTLIQRIVQQRLAGRVITVNWIPTTANSADEPSRASPAAEHPGVLFLPFACRL